MASSSSNCQHINDAIVTSLLPKTPCPSPSLLEEQSNAAGLDDALVSQPSLDPPPPYSGTRTSRRTRTYQTMNTRRALRVSDDSYVTTENEVAAEATETSPFLQGRRRIALSHSSTTQPVHSAAQTVSSSSRTVLSLFWTDLDRSIADPSLDVAFSTRARRYFRPLIRLTYYSALFHLVFVNFSYGLVAWVCLFVGTLTGTALLITLPLGAVLCFLNLLGARAFARGEIALQTRFHGPLSVSPPDPPRPIFSRNRTLQADSDAIHFEVAVPEKSFLKLTFLMFRDPTSYQALFYFLVIKPGFTLLTFIAVIALVPPAFILVVPAPAVLRAVRRVGIWQAELAIDALS